MINLETQNVFQIWVRGRPYAQSRARHVEKDGRKIVYSSNSKGLKKWRADLIAQLLTMKRQLQLVPLEGALCVDIVFCMPIKERTRWGEICHTKPDKDNLEKAVLDCMAEAQLFAVGDSQVGVGQTVKLWCAPGHEGAQVQVKRVRVAKKIPAQGGDGLEWLSDQSR